MNKITCAYYVTEIYAGNKSAPYRERMDKAGNVVPFLPNGVAYVTLDDSGYVIRSDTDEVIAIGQRKRKRQLERELRLLKSKMTLINGVDICEYYRRIEKENESNETQ